MCGLTLQVHAAAFLSHAMTLVCAVHAVSRLFVRALCVRLEGSHETSCPAPQNTTDVRSVCTLSYSGVPLEACMYPVA